MATYQTPGVYIEEISTLPPSVAEVSTAIPAFIGYTAKGAGTVARVSTLLDYESLFGGAHSSPFTVTAHVDDSTGLHVIDSVTREEATTTPAFLMHYGVSLYFKNGGGSCYIVSIGDYDATPAKGDFEAGLAKLEQEDEPTLLLLTDAVNLDAADYHDLGQQALAQCAKLGDRFVILDVKDGDVAGFRNSIGTTALMYGAAYHPYLETTLNYSYTEHSVTVVDTSAPGGDGTSWEHTFGATGIAVKQSGMATAPRAQITRGDDGQAVGFIVDGGKLTISDVGARTGSEVVAAWTAWVAAGNDAGGFEIVAAGGGRGAVETTGSSVVDLDSASGGTMMLDTLKDSQTALYNQVKKALDKPRAVLPPSCAMAGIYAQVDRGRGVWKAPANVSVSSVSGPIEKITHDGQENLNIDATAGKSINAIRAFTGKGTLVWGARTLAGNDNEWRYISVRRLFIMIEESARKSTSFAVFEPNDATTWLKVKGMLESYLYGLWEKGAMQGSTPDAAYFVNVGLGKTMTTQDVLEGRMIVEIGIAAVRPAEFIILRFTHKLPEG